MTTVLCTLYNSLYLDKGLVLYDSLCECAKDFKLYVLCMDDKCFDVLSDLKQEYHIPVRLADFEAGDDALLTAKGNRSMGEYCWTCSSSFIRYVLKHYGEDTCTYIDADMYFYNDPQVLIDEMLAAGKSVMVVPHRFPEDNKELAKTVGTYCVEFNTFLNNPESLEVLEYWRNRCLESVARLDDGIHYGDQKYLDELEEKFKCVHVCKNIGAGVAPWNLSLFKWNEKTKSIVFTLSCEPVSIVFYHFQSLEYISETAVDICIRNVVDNQMVAHLYKPYLKSLSAKKYLLADSYNLNVLITGHPAQNNRFDAIKRSRVGQFLFYWRRKLQGRTIVRF